VLRARVHIDARLWFSCDDSKYNKLLLLRYRLPIAAFVLVTCVFGLLSGSVTSTPVEQGAISIVVSCTCDLSRLRRLDV
jgi:hypothetical protein